MQNNAYAKAAVEALMAWNGKTKEEAEKMVSDLSREELEGIVGAEGSVKAGFESLIRCLQDKGVEISEESKNELYSAVLDGPEDSAILKELGVSLNEAGNPYEIALDALTAIHDNRVRTSPKKFEREGKQYMHLPLEMIGWNTVYSDYIFLKPIMESMGIEMDEEQIKAAYQERSVAFLKSLNLDRYDVDSVLVSLMEDPVAFYPALKDYSEEKITQLKNPAFLKDVLKGQVTSKHNIDELLATVEGEERQEAGMRWREASKQLGYSQREDEWDKNIESALDPQMFHAFGTLAMDETIQIMSDLKSGKSFEEIAEKIDPDYFMRYGGAVLRFAKNGPEFYRFMSEKLDMPLSPEQEVMVAKVERENTEFELSDKKKELSDKEKEIKKLIAENEKLKKQLAPRGQDIGDD